MNATVFLSGGSALGWMVIMAIIVTVMAIYYFFKNVRARNHTIGDVEHKSIDGAYNTKIEIDIYREKYDERVELSVVSEKEIARFQMEKVLEELNKEENHIIHFHAMSRALPTYADYVDGKLVYSKD